MKEWAKYENFYCRIGCNAKNKVGISADLV